MEKDAKNNEPEEGLKGFQERLDGILSGMRERSRGPLSSKLSGQVRDARGRAAARRSDADRASTGISTAKTNDVTDQKGLLPVVELEKKLLDQMTRSALEIAPMEALGILFGSFTKRGIVVSEAHVIQKVFSRDRMSICLEQSAIERVKELGKELSTMEFVGGFHTHPYFDPRWIRGERDAGVRLSGQDILSFYHEFSKRAEEAERDFPKIEMIVAYYPWQLWGGSAEGKEWKLRKAKIGCMAIDREAKSREDLFVEMEAEEVEVFGRAVEGPSIRTQEMIPAYGETIRNFSRLGDDDALARIEEEMELVKEKCKDTVKGFDIRVACHHIWSWENGKRIGLKPVSVR